MIINMNNRLSSKITWSNCIFLLEGFADYLNRVIKTLMPLQLNATLCIYLKRESRGHLELLLCTLRLFSILQMLDFKLTITSDEPSVVSVVLLEFAAVWGSFAGGPLHEEVVFVKGAFPSSGIQ